MASKLFSCSINSLECNVIEVEAEIINGLPKFDIVGLADTSIQESRERVFSAIKNSNFEFPRRKKIVNLAPADLRKQGPYFDLPIALSLLIGSKQIEIKNFEDYLFVGELGLDGSLRHINGVLNIASFASKNGFKKLFLPICNAKEASLISDIEVYGANSLSEICEHFLDIRKINIYPHQNIEEYIKNMDLYLERYLDMEDIQGQEHAKRALEIAAAGAHNILLSGPPGSGKTLLAKSFPSLLSPLSLEESLEVSKIYSIAGKLPKDIPLKIQRPFRTVHHSASGASIVGGGKIPKPGEISLSHRGVLFLDEIPEFPTKVLEILRQPLEDRVITINRISGTLSFPAHFILIAARNPCPCGYLSDPKKNCSCSPIQIKNYQKKLSGPLLDRIDMIIEVPRLEFNKLASNLKNENSAQIRERIIKARNLQYERFKDSNIFTNSEMDSGLVKKFCFLDREGTSLIKEAVLKLNLSGRNYFRLLKVSRTIADLEGIENIKAHHIAEALQYRQREEGVM